MAKQTAATARKRHEVFGSWNTSENCTIFEANNTVRGLEAMGIPIDRVWLIPKISGAQSNDVAIEQAITDYQVDPETDLVEVYLHARGTPDSNGDNAALIAVKVAQAAELGAEGFRRLYQSFYPGSDATTQMLNLPAVNESIKAAIRKLANI